ncbi:hypothetical protein QTP88_014755 [Uroleucon formosanum]
MKDIEIYSLLESITDDRAFDSDIGGDSDAEDNLVLKSESNLSDYSVQQNELAGPSYTERTSRPIRSKSYIDFSNDNLSSSEEIDDFDKDLNFLLSSLLMQAHISSSSDENIDDNFSQPIHNTQ